MARSRPVVRVAHRHRAWAVWLIPAGLVVVWAACTRPAVVALQGMPAMAARASPGRTFKGTQAVAAAAVAADTTLGAAMPVVLAAAVWAFRVRAPVAGRLHRLNVTGMAAQEDWMAKW